jgi:7-cyano-7-deazaguanine synthase
MTIFYIKFNMGFGKIKETNPEIEATILLSGGIDSMLCAHFMRTKHYRSQGVFVNFGQPAAEHEKCAAESITKDLSLLPLLHCKAKLATNIDSGEIIGRNAFLIFSAMTLAGINQGILVIGVHAGTNYYDCAPSFIRSVGDLVSEYTDGRLRLLAPLLDWEKPEIITYAKTQGLPLYLTYSCENGTNPPCGVCLSCRDRERMGC